MKRLAVAVAIALSATPALAQRGAPFEQTEIDRLVPVFPDYVAPARTTRPLDGMPPEQSHLDLGALGMQEPVLIAQLGGGSYKSAAEPEEERKSVWANDHNFIAPPQ